VTFFWIASASPPGDGVGSQSRSPVIARTKSEEIQKRKEMDCHAAIATHNDGVGSQSRSRHPERSEAIQKKERHCEGEAEV
jgi:hypothetical protein